MTNEEIDKKIAEIDEKYKKIEATKQQLLVNVDECSAESLRLQGEYRAYKAMKDDLAKLPVETVVT